MADFNPDAFIAENNVEVGEGFDPDAFMKSNDIRVPVPAQEDNIYEKQVKGQSFIQNFAAGYGGTTQAGILSLQQLAGRKLTDAEIEEFRKSRAALRKTVGGTIGEVASFIGPGIAVAGAPVIAPAIAAGGLPGVAATVGTGALTGALESGMQPVKEAESRAGNAGIGAAYGAAAPLVIGGAIKTGGLVASILAPFMGSSGLSRSAGTMLNKALGRHSLDTAAIIRRGDDLAQAGQGAYSQPTAAQAMVQGGGRNTELAALERLTGRVLPTEQAISTQAEQAARGQMLTSFGKDPATLAAAQASRQAAATTNYGKALSQAVKADADLGAILRDPYVKGVIPAVRKSVEARQAKGVSVPAAEQLEMVKQELNKVLKASPVDAPSTNVIRDVTDVQSRLNQWMTNKLPGYDVAKQQYAKDSSDIFQMKVGQLAKDALEKPLGGGERKAAFAGLIDKENKLIKEAGGFTKKELSQQLEPANLAKLQKVIGQIDVDTTLEELARKGSTSQSLKDAVGGAVNLPNLMNSSVAIMNGFLRRTLGQGQVRTLKELQAVMQDPVLTAKLIEQASAREANAMKYLMGVMKATAIGYPATKEQIQ